MKTENTIAHEFDQFSVNYTEDMVRCVPHYLELLSCFVKDLPEGFLPHHILDLGCGNGNVTYELTQLFPKARFELLDASSEMITLCKKRFDEFNVSYITSFFKDHHYKENYYDMIVAGFSLHHCDSNQKQELSRSIYNSLKPGGVFGYSDLMINKNTPEHIPFLSNWEHFVNKNFPNNDKWNWLMEHYETYDKPDPLEYQIQWLQEAGFTNITKTVMDGYWVYIRAIKT